MPVRRNTKNFTPSINRAQFLFTYGSKVNPTDKITVVTSDGKMNSLKTTLGGIEKKAESKQTSSTKRIF